MPEPGDLIKVEGHGSRVYRAHGYGPDGSITCWGPLTSSAPQWRSFRADTVQRYQPRSRAGRYEDVSR